MTDEQLPQPGDTPAPKIPYVVPESLDLLTGPKTGIVELPTRLDGDPQTSYNLASIDDAISLYSKVVSEASTEDDLTDFLNRDLLVTLWPRLQLPGRCAGLWNRAFQQLAAAGPHYGKR